MHLAGSEMPSRYVAVERSGSEQFRPVVVGFVQDRTSRNRCPSRSHRNRVDSAYWVCTYSVCMAVKEALLALLAEGPKHGYELKSQFDAATGAAWPLNVGQVYTTLQRLERDGLVETDGEPDEGGRQPYQLTAEGRESLGEWVAAPIEQKLAMRDEVSMKVLLTVATSIEDPSDVIARQRDSAMGSLQSFMALKREASDKPLAWRLHLDRLTYALEAEIRWLETVENRLMNEQSQNGNGKRGAE